MLETIKKMKLEEKKSHKQIAEEIGWKVSRVERFCSLNSILSRKRPAPKYDVELIRKMIEEDGMQQHAVAKHFGTDRTTIERYCKRFHIKTQRTGPRKGSNSGELNPAWKGGRSVHKGYVMIKRPEHPQAWANGYCPEHRLVAEKVLGRYLTSDEAVHHIDGNRSNNSLSNLEVFADNALHLIHHRIERGMSPADAYKRHINLLQSNSFRFPKEYDGGRLRLSDYRPT